MKTSLNEIYKHPIDTQLHADLLNSIKLTNISECDIKCYEHNNWLLVEINHEFGFTDKFIFDLINKNILTVFTNRDEYDYLLSHNINGDLISKSNGGHLDITKFDKQVYLKGNSPHTTKKHTHIDNAPINSDSDDFYSKDDLVFSFVPLNSQFKSSIDDNKVPCVKIYDQKSYKFIIIMSANPITINTVSKNGVSDILLSRNN